MILKQTTAYSRKFLMVLSSDHVTGATGKTVTVKLSKGAGATFGAAAGTVTELDSTNGPGWYQVALTTVDTGTLGDLAYACTASGCDSSDFKDEVQAQVFTDLNLDIATGRVKILSGVQQNQALTIMFPMTIQGVPTPGLTVTGQRNFGSGFSLIGGTITDLGGGDYKASLLAADTNAAAVIYKIGRAHV